MKKIMSLLRNSTLKRIMGVLPIIVLLPISFPALAANYASNTEKWPVETDAWPQEAWPGTTSFDNETAKWPASEEAWPTSEISSFIALRTVVLHPADNKNEASISTDVVFDGGEYKISYQGRLYKIKHLSDTPYYDSQVEIGIIYVFRLKLHPYE